MIFYLLKYIKNMGSSNDINNDNNVYLKLNCIEGCPNLFQYQL